MILGVGVVVGVLIVVEPGISDADTACGRRQGNSSQLVLVQVKGTSCFAEVALNIIERCFCFLDEAQYWPMFS